MRIIKDIFNLYLILFFVLIMLIMCTSSCIPSRVPYEIKKPIIEFISPLDSEKAKIYVHTFEDARKYSEIGRRVVNFSRTVKYYPVEKLPEGLYFKVDEGKLEKANMGQVVSDTFVDILRRNRINAVSLKDSKPTMGKHDLLIRGKVIDYLFTFPCFYPITSPVYYTGLEIAVDNFDGKELMYNKKCTKVYKSRFPFRRVTTDNLRGDRLYAEILDLELKEICKEIINDEEFKKVIAALETTEGDD